MEHDAYDLKRAGEHVELSAKQIKNRRNSRFFALMKKPNCSLLGVVCGKGTYIRSLARDLGRALNSGAYLTELRRTKVGDVSVENCINYDSFGEWLNQQR